MIPVWRQLAIPMTRALWLSFLAIACSEPVQPAFVMPKNIEDARGRLLVAIPEGREIEGARQWMAEHHFQCEPPMPSAAEAHAQICRPEATAPADAGWRKWEVVLLERRGRLADVQVR
ncbi:MAG TPA: hypothetical protein VH083_21420 [Myxococcales bacterium]|jgi:hypothetical protein|nr:hypothetical protein [Myxococcales bacterium]